MPASVSAQLYMSLGNYGNKGDHTLPYTVAFEVLAEDDQDWTFQRAGLPVRNPFAMHVSAEHSTTLVVHIIARLCLQTVACLLRCFSLPQHLLPLFGSVPPMPHHPKAFQEVSASVLATPGPRGPCSLAAQCLALSSPYRGRSGSPRFVWYSADYGAVGVECTQPKPKCNSDGRRVT